MFLLRSINIGNKQNSNVWVLAWLHETKILLPKLCCMDTDSFIVYIKTEDIHVDFAKDVEKEFNSYIYEWDRPLPKRKYKKLTILMRDELCGKMTEFGTLKP